MLDYIGMNLRNNLFDTLRRLKLAPELSPFEEVLKSISSKFGKLDELWISPEFLKAFQKLQDGEEK